MRHALAAFLLAAASPAAAAPFLPLLGQFALDAADPDSRYQTGYLRAGHFFQNTDSAAAARPDGSGAAYNLYELLLHDAVRGSRVGFVGDALFLTDRDRGNFNLAQFHYLLGIVLKDRNFRLQFDREEAKPLDRGGRSLRAWDARAALDFDWSSRAAGTAPFPPPGGRRRLPELAARASLAVGYYLHNDNLPARADNSGEAALRYVARGELTHARTGLRLGAEADLKTQKHRTLRPVNRELALGLGASLRGAELMVWRRTSDVLDRPGFHRFHYFTLTFPFDTR